MLPRCRFSTSMAERCSGTSFKNKLTFPIGVDIAGQDTPIPVTMASYGMRGTRTMILIRRNGTVYHHGFG